MNKLTQWIADNPVVSTWITIISLIGVVITIIALIMQIKDKKRKAIYYTISSNILVDEKVSQINGIKVLFKDNEVNTIVVTNIKIWNGGNEILEPSDFYPENSLKISIPNDEQILAVGVSDETAEECKFTITNNNKNNEAGVSFYCLEPKQSVSLIVYHTNTNEKETKILGKIKGGKILNKSIELSTEGDEIYISTGKYRIYFEREFLGIGLPMINIIPNILGISIRKENKKEKFSKKD